MASFAIGVAAEVAASDPAVPAVVGPRMQADGRQQVHASPIVRPATGYEVESLTLSPTSKADLAQWAELAAQGFHVVTCISAADGKQIILLERATPLTGGALRIPQSIEQDAASSAELKAKLQAIIAERMQAVKSTEAASSGAPRGQIVQIPAPVAPTPVPHR